MQTTNLEAALCDALEQAGREYSRALNELASLTSALAGGSGNEQTALQIQRLAIRTRDTEHNVSRLREQWQTYGRPPGQRLREVMSTQEYLLRELIRRIDAIERIAHEARDRLIPRIDASTQSQEMRSAYARSIRHAIE